MVALLRQHPLPPARAMRSKLATCANLTCEEPEAPMRARPVLRGGARYRTHLIPNSALSPYSTIDAAHRRAAATATARATSGDAASPRLKAGRQLSPSTQPVSQVLGIPGPGGGLPHLTDSGTQRADGFSGLAGEALHEPGGPCREGRGARRIHGKCTGAGTDPGLGSAVQLCMERTGAANQLPM